MLRRLTVQWKGRCCNAVLKRQKHDHAARSIGVIGSGIAGLTTTLLLARQLLPRGKHRIVLYDSNPRPGGWVRSDRVHVNGKEKESARAEASAVVEAGPRSLRPAGLPGLAMLDLVSIQLSGVF
jgi:oxygen-dependent protoporphyrinogen oxidase